MADWIAVLCDRSNVHTGIAGVVSHEAALADEDVSWDIQYMILLLESDGLGLDAYRSALDDREIERVTLAAVAAGADEWLDRFINERLASETAADHALAITKASCRPANAQCDALLGGNWGRGFLGGAASAASARYERAAHAAHGFALCPCQLACFP